jgi:lipopolysaccharide/colanic/teichoic acid biosynthesis glycosyltransferase
MVVDSEPEGPVWAEPGDPRVTPVGRWLRRARLDELPQVMNVLRGEMSFVGPRPERPEFVDDLAARIPFYRARHSVRPGLTGWASIHQGYAGSPEDALVKLQYDLFYIKHQSVFLDAYILLRTAATVLRLAGV